MINIAVCDDETPCLSDTRLKLEQWSETTRIQIRISCFNNGDLLIFQSRTEKFDIVFLDIMMPMLNGMDTARELREKDDTMKIIFLTSSPEFALESYSVKAADYCLKPVIYERLKEIMDEHVASCHREPESLVLKTTGGYQKIHLHDIEYIEAQNKRVFFFLKEKNTVEALEPLYYFEKKLTEEKGFFKCHRSYLVYIPNVDYFSSTQIRTRSGCIIPIARRYTKLFHDAYFSIMFHE